MARRVDRVFRVSIKLAAEFLAGVLTNGYMYCQNLTTNATRSIVIGPTNASGKIVGTFRLKAQEIGVFRLNPGTPLFAYGVGGTVNLRTLVVEN